MDHETYENQMIDSINRHAEEKNRCTGTSENTIKAKRRVFTKTDVNTLKRGLKRTMIALLTTVLFGLSVFSFIAAATATGYWAVILFFSAIVLLGWTFVFLYAQGVTDAESKGDSK